MENRGRGAHEIWGVAGEIHIEGNVVQMDLMRERQFWAVDGSSGVMRLYWITELHLRDRSLGICCSKRPAGTTNGRW